jgi:hypothetical protein
MGEKGNAYRSLVGKPKTKRPLGRPIYSWEYSIKMDLERKDGAVRNRIDLAQDRDHWRTLLRTVMNFQVP